jgi:ribonuclease BN (tRNA processing enzyme)
MEFAGKAGVQNLVLFHHDPYHSDDELEEVLKEARQQWPAAEDRVCLANEGMTIAIGTGGIRLRSC